MENVRTQKTGRIPEVLRTRVHPIEIMKVKHILDWKTDNKNYFLFCYKIRAYLFYFLFNTLFTVN